MIAIAGLFAQCNGAHIAGISKCNGNVEILMKFQYRRMRSMDVFLMKIFD
jgi:hypothetical protein